MTAIATTVRPTTLVAGVALPAPSQALASAIRDVIDPHPDTGRSSPPVYVQGEAKRLLAAAEAALAPATREDWRKWLLPLAILPKAPPGPEAFSAAVSAIAFALHDMPASLLTMGRQREALRRHAWWPSPANLAEWLMPEAAPLRAHARALRMIASATPAPRAPTGPLMSMEERKAYAARVTAELRAEQAEASPPPPVKPSHLTREQLAAAYASAGLVDPRKAG